MDNTLKEIYKQVAVEFGISIEEVDKIIRSQFDFAKKVMETGDKESLQFKNVRIKHWGMFYVTDGLIKRIKITREKINKRKNKDE